MKVDYANYRYSLTTKQQTELQLFLRRLAMVNEKLRSDPAWHLLHDLTYAESWTDKPQFALAGTDRERTRRMRHGDVESTARYGAKK